MGRGRKKKRPVSKIDSEKEKPFPLEESQGNNTFNAQMGEDAKPFFDVKEGENTVIGHIEGVEIFRLTFNPKNFIENFYKSVRIPKPSEEVKALVRAALQQHNAERSEEEINAAIEKATWEIMKVMYDARIHDIAEEINKNLAGILIAVMEDAIQAYALGGSIQLNEQAGRTFPIAQLKNDILQQHWSRIRDLAGIKQGGKRRKPEFDWSDENIRRKFVERVDKLRPLWEKALNEEDEIRWGIGWPDMLKDNPELVDISKPLLKQAVNARTTYRDQGESIPPDYRPFAYALKQTAQEFKIFRQKGQQKGKIHGYVSLQKYYAGTHPSIKQSKKQ